jgi:uncharacterized protein
MGDLIPLFPLGTPLFPGVVLPLNVFEPRYRRLVRDLMAQPDSDDGRFFGVVAIRQGWEVERIAPAAALFDVGCTARVQVVRPQPDGGFQVVCVGGDRFRLLDVVVGEDPPYLQAEVEWLAEEEAAEEAAGDEVAASVARGSMAVLVRTVRALFARYVIEVADLQGGRDADDGNPGDPDAPDDPAAGLGGEISELLAGVADDPTALSYLVASISLLTAEDRQALLAEPATGRRLAAEARMLRRELTLLRAVGAVPVPVAQFATPMTVN